MILRSFDGLRTQDRRGTAGTTLLEILVAMLVLGLVATGILTAFVFTRRVTWRSGSELSGAGLVTETTEALRGAVAAPLANGLSLNPGVYVDQNMQNRPAGANPILGLNLPDDFRTRFQTSAGTAGATVALANHGDGRMIVVEGAADLDGDLQVGLDLNGDGQIDLRRVRVRVKFTSPTT